MMMGHEKMIKRMAVIYFTSIRQDDDKYDVTENENSKSEYSPLLW